MQDNNNKNVSAVRKGPWTAEEDEILQVYVHEHGPCNWSSIRSKGLLPRTGKSCRLRWVNKLKPDLKTGCKFSEEEEKIVIKLQSEFGNKWAKISKYLPGRTDNDVKNFWSTRRKRLSRLHSHVTRAAISKANNNLDNKTSSLASYEALTFKVTSQDRSSYEEESCNFNSKFDETEDLMQTQENTCVLPWFDLEWEQIPLYPPFDFPLVDVSMDLSFQESLSSGSFFDFSAHGSGNWGVFLDDFPTEIFDELEESVRPTSSTS